MMMPDHTAKYNALIKDKAEEIRKLCFQYDIPCFMAFGTKQSEDGEFKIECASVLPEVMGYNETTDRRFLNFINVQNGFVTVPPVQEGESMPLDDDFVRQAE